MVTESEIFFFLLLRLRATLLDCGSAACTAMPPIFSLFLFRAADLFLPYALFSILGPIKTADDETTFWTRGTDDTNIAARHHRQSDLRLETTQAWIDRAPVFRHQSPQSLVACPCSGLFALLLLFRVNTPTTTNRQTTGLSHSREKEHDKTFQLLPNTKCISV